MHEIQEMRVQSLGRDDPLEEEMTTQSSILAWEIPWTEKPGGHSPLGHKESDTTEHTQHTQALAGEIFTSCFLSILYSGFMWMLSSLLS